jgi:replicative DNA helicase
MTDNPIPNNIEAEEAILGGILAPEAFYLIAHQQIYRVALELYHHSKARR